MKVIYHPEAEAELRSAARYYEDKVPELGQRFLDAAERAVESIVRSPTMYRIVEADIRLCLMERFPYAIYYRLLPDQIRILVWKHHSRDPDYWKARLSDES